VLLSSRRTVLYSFPTPKRVADILSELTQCELADHMSPAVAETLFGRIRRRELERVGFISRERERPS